MTNQTRTPAGVPTGGQFATTDRPDGAELAAAAPLTTSVEDDAITVELSDGTSVEFDAGMFGTGLAYWPGGELRILRLDGRDTRCRWRSDLAVCGVR